MTIEEQDQIVETIRSSGKTVRQWCEENHMNPNTVFNYCSKYNHRHGLKKKDEKKPAIVELIPVTDISGTVKVQIGNCSIDVNDQTDLDLLKKISQALK